MFSETSFAYGLRGATSQNMATFITVAVRDSNPTDNQRFSKRNSPRILAFINSSSCTSLSKVSHWGHTQCNWSDIAQQIQDIWNEYNLQSVILVTCPTKWKWYSWNPSQKKFARPTEYFTDDVVMEETEREREQWDPIEEESRLRVLRGTSGPTRE
jgi:hypothetical protein